jgi:hypothetical protein
MVGCDAERHWHEVGAFGGLPCGTEMPALCQCGDAALKVSRVGGPWMVTLLDGTAVLGPLTHDNLVRVVDTELAIGIRRPISEG